MDFADLKKALDRPDVGQAMHRFAGELFPICRSITGSGVRDTLRLIRDRIPLEAHEVPSGTAVFDWTVPLEWNIRDAYIADEQGRRLVDFKQCNLHVVNYSRPIKARMRLAELRDHLFAIPEHPDWIPYRTSYYKESWGFCLSHRQYQGLGDAVYEVCIDSTLEPGHLTYGECYLAGQSPDEVLISCHICHPSLANDNLSGIAVATFLAQALAAVSRRYSYRLLFIPGTIGSITWLARNQEKVSRIKHGLVLTGVGDSGSITYKRSRRGDAEIDRATTHVLRHSGKPNQVIDFFPYGYDERQYCSPGFNLPVGCLMRTPHGQYPEYHTSADNLDFIHPESLEDTLRLSLEILCVLENNGTYRTTNPYGEPQLGKRGLYRSVGGQKEGALNEMALLWVLNLSDGQHSLLDIAERAGTPFETIYAAAQALAHHGLLR
jgi:aminopeptidase-like protein